LFFFDIIDNEPERSEGEYEDNVIYASAIVWLIPIELEQDFSIGMNSKEYLKHRAYRLYNEKNFSQVKLPRLWAYLSELQANLFSKDIESVGQSAIVPVNQRSGSISLKFRLCYYYITQII
jgi:hypothetical protein